MPENNLHFQTPSLPKGGGNISSNDTAKSDAFTGAASYSIPFIVTSARGEHTPSIALTYHSGQGNSEFGIGFSVPTSNITVNARLGTPKYDGTDTFLLDDQTEMVPTGTPVVNNGWKVITYLPRIQDEYSLIEQWVNISDGTSYWQIIGEDNTKNIYGQSTSARIFNPQDTTQVFEWLIEQTP